MKKQLLLLLIAILFAQTGMAQEQFGTVDGKVKSSTGEELVNAVVLFKNFTDSTKIYPAVCDASGCYHQELPYGQYTYVISYLGEYYTPKENQIVVNRLSIEISTIVIALKDKMLDEITVIAKRPFVSYNGSNAKYNLSANPASIGGNLLEGIKLIPGVQVQESGGLSVFGFYNLKVAVNGRLLTISNDELQAYLASLGVSDVEIVELIRQPGPEYGTGGEAVLNIVTKKKPNDGLNVFVSTELVYRTLFSENARMRINYNKGGWRNYISYQFSDTRRKESLTTSIGADSTTVKPYNGHNLQVGSEFQISPKQVVGVRTHLSVAKEHINYNRKNSTDMERKVTVVNLYHTLSGTRWNWKNYVDYTFSSNNRDYFRSGAEDNTLQDRFHYFRVASDFIYWITPLWGTLIGCNRNDAWFETDSSPKSNNLNNSNYKESNTSAYITVRYRNESIDTYGGIQFNYDRRESTAKGTIDNIDNICNWQPYFSFAYEISRNHRLTTSLQTYYRRPSFRDLAPYTSYSGFLYRLGNPNLQNSMRYNISINYTYRRAAMLEVNLSDEKHPIVEYLMPYNGGYALAKTNLNSSRYLRIVAGSPIPIIYRENGAQWIASTYLAYHLQKDRGIVNEADYTGTFNAYYLQHRQSFNLPSHWYFDAQITYYSPLFAGVYKTETQWWMDFTVSKRIQNWKFYLNGYDIFNTNVAKGKIEGMKNRVWFVKDWHSPKITFGVNLTLGNKDLKTTNYKNKDSELRLNKSANEGINLQQN